MTHIFSTLVQMFIDLEVWSTVNLINYYMVQYKQLVIECI